MTRKQKVEVKMSEARTKLGTLLDLETRSEDQNKEFDALKLELRSLEGDLQAAVALEATEPEPKEIETRSEGDAASREIRALMDKATLGNYLEAAIEGRSVSGVEHELSQAFGLKGGVPLEFFETRQDKPKDLETRAVTPAPSTTDRNVQRVVPALFDRSVAAWLGIDMPTVGPGVPAYPVLSANLGGGPKAKGVTAAEDAGALTVTTTTPHRITGALRMQREDLAVFPQLEEAFRTNLGMVLADSLDGQVLNGNNTAPNIDGLLRQLTDATAPAANAETWVRYHTALVSHIDGLYAVDEMGVRMLVGEETYRHAASQFRATESNESFTAYCNRVFGGVRASRRIAAPASSIQGAVVRRTNPGGDAVAVVPMWQGVQFINDPYTGAGKGEIVVTALMLIGDVVLLRSGAFVEDSFRLA